MDYRSRTVAFQRRVRSAIAAAQPRRISWLAAVLVAFGCSSAGSKQPGSGGGGDSSIGGNGGAPTTTTSFTLTFGGGRPSSGSSSASTSDSCAGAACDAGVDSGPASVCGDGVISGTEQCDDGNPKGGDGCSASCWLEPGFACIQQSSTPNSICHPTVCGDGNKEGFEQCDDGNLVPYDGCSPTCTLEPKCNGTGGCTGVCGDGLVFPNEECDDGNTISGDGCSADCKIEPGLGYSCVNVPQDPATSLDIPILYRDMLYASTTAFPTPRPTGGGHPDFNTDAYNTGGWRTGLVQFQLGADAEPVFASVMGSPVSGGAAIKSLTGSIPFCWWFHETGCDGAGSKNPYAKLVYLDQAGNPTTLALKQTAPGQNKYRYDNQAFFPIDKLGWNAGSNPQEDGGHNFSFTSELHHVFTYHAVQSVSAAPVFHFSGDDDVWVFINGQLVVDLGGMHGPEPADIPLTPANATLLGLTDGGWYSIDLFQAERHVTGSTYTLELSGFQHMVTNCKPSCGDGLIARAAGEQCDNGAANVAPSAATYGQSGVCTTSCKWAPYCGDGIVQTEFGEACDRAPDCDSNCQIKPPL